MDDLCNLRFFPIPNMILTVEEMARRYLSKVPPAIDGQGGCHAKTFTVACALVKGFNLSPEEARPLLWEWNQGCVPPWSEAELEHKLRQADGVADSQERGWLRLEAPTGGAGQSTSTSAPREVRRPAAPPPKPTFQAEKLKAFAAPWRQFSDTAWLLDRSKVDPRRLTAEGYLSNVFREGEKVIVFTEQQSQGQGVWPIEPLPERGPQGVWYLGQPVDGKAHPNPRSLGEDGKPKMSRRSEESVTDWRHLVLESDEADARDWMAALVQLPLRIVAIYTSGKRSIHALVRVDAPTKQEWDNCVKMIRPVLVTLGADPKAMSAVRLTRLPGCWRGEKLQKLLYLNPNPEPVPICTVPRRRDVLRACEVFLEAIEPLTPDQVAEQGGADQLADCRATLEWCASVPRAVEQANRLRAWEARA